MLLSFFVVEFLLKFQQGWHKFVEPLPPKKWKTAQPKKTTIKWHVLERVIFKSRSLRIKCGFGLTDNGVWIATTPNPISFLNPTLVIHSFDFICICIYFVGDCVLIFFPWAFTVRGAKSKQCFKNITRSLQKIKLVAHTEKDGLRFISQIWFLFWCMNYLLNTLHVRFYCSILTSWEGLALWGNGINHFTDMI